MRYEANVLVYIEGARDDGHIESIRAALSGRNGITRIRATVKPQRLMLVDYDPRVITARGIRASVCEHGVEARLIGL